MSAGFAVDPASLPADWVPIFTNENDGTNEGIAHTSLPYYTVQFHPEATAGPQDLECLFDVFLARCRNTSDVTPMPKAISSHLTSTSCKLGACRLVARVTAPVTLLSV